jgi:hypothetical protein
LAPVEEAMLVDTFSAHKRAAAFALYSMAIVTAPVSLCSRKCTSGLVWENIGISIGFSRTVAGERESACRESPSIGPNIEVSAITLGTERKRMTDWRRGWDSNPRDPFGPNGFQDRRFQPLTHPSGQL